MAEADPRNQCAKQIALTDFDRPRVRILESFAELEITIASALRDSSAVCATAPLGQKLAKSSYNFGTKLRQELDDLLTVRADLAHSKVRLLQGRPAYAVYINSSRPMSKDTAATVLSLDEHEDVDRRVKAAHALLLETIKRGMAPNPPAK